jgi:hypothetical protein
MFHFAPGELGRTGSLWHWRANGRGWNMFNDSTIGLKEEAAIGSASPPLGCSAEYRGKTVESPTLRQSGNAVDVLRCMTILTSDLATQLRTTITPSDPGLEQVHQSLDFNIGNLIVQQSPGESRFIWQHNR